VAIGGFLIEKSVTNINPKYYKTRHFGQAESFGLAKIKIAPLSIDSYQLPKNNLEILATFETAL
jgi:hypothetical protein